MWTQHTCASVSSACAGVCVWVQNVNRKQKVALFPSTTRGQVPCPVHGEGSAVMQPPCVGLGGSCVARILKVTTHTCTLNPPPVPATSMKQSLHMPPPLVRLLHELPGEGVNQSMGGEGVNSSTAVWWEKGICVPWKSARG